MKKVAVVDTKVKLTDVKEKKGSQRTRIVFNEQDEGNFDNNQKMGQLRDTLLKEFKDIFTTELTINDRINLPPVNIETVANKASFRPIKKTTAIETHLHLQSAAGKELSKMLNARFLEGTLGGRLPGSQQDPQASWLSHGRFKLNTETLKFR